MIVNLGGQVDPGGRLEPSTWSGGRWGYINLDDPYTVSWLDRDIQWDLFDKRATD